MTVRKLHRESHRTHCESHCESHRCRHLIIPAMRRGRGIGVLASGKFDAVLPPLVCLERLVCVVKRRAGMGYLLLAALCSAACCTPSLLWSSRSFVGPLRWTRWSYAVLLRPNVWSSSPPRAGLPCVHTVSPIADLHRPSKRRRQLTIAEELHERHRRHCGHRRGSVQRSRLHRQLH